MLTDIRHAIRLLSRDRGATALSIVSMAVGIALCTVVGSACYTLLFGRLRVPAPEAIVSVYGASLAKGGYAGVSMPDYRDLAARSDLFDALSAYVRVPFLLDDGRQSERIYAEVATGNYHAMLGLQPELGRRLLPDDDDAGAPVVMVVSDDFWRRRFGARPDVLGRAVRVGGVPAEIVGVMPAGFRGVLLDWGGAPDVWLPLGQLARLSRDFARAALDDRRDARWLQIAGRLRNGVPISAAAAALRQQAAGLAQAYPSSNADTTFTLLPASRARFWPGRRAEAVDLTGALLLAVGVVLLVSVLNVVTLQLSRFVTRRRELSVRLAVGATRSRLVRLMLVEGSLLTWSAAIVSVPLVLVLARGVSRLDLPLFISTRALDPAPDWRTFAVVALAAVILGAVLALAPAVRAWRLEPRRGLAGDQPGNGRSHVLGAGGLRFILAAVQIAMCLVLAVGAGLMTRSLIGLLRVDLGYRTAGVTLFGIESYLAPASGAGGAFAQHRELLSRVRRLPGVEAAALAHDALPTPMRTSRTVTAVDATDPAAGTALAVATNVVSAGYFETIAMPLAAGRAFTDRDSDTSAPVAVVNEDLARRLWGGTGRALHRRLRVDGEPQDREVVGVTRRAVYREIDERPLPFLFLPETPEWQGVMTLHVRGPREATRLIADVREELRAVNPALAFADVRTLDDHVARRLAGPRLTASLAVVAGFAGLALAMLGIYSVLAHLVAQCRRELAIRTAIGASPRQLAVYVIGIGGRITLAGMALGLAGSVATARVTATQLRGVDAYDPLVYVATLAVVLLVSVVACLPPARTASRIEPAAVLRRP